MARAKEGAVKLPHRSISSVWSSQLGLGHAVSPGNSSTARSSCLTTRPPGKEY